MITMRMMMTMMMTVMSRTRRHRTFVPPSKNSPRHAGYLASDIHSVFLQPRLRLHANGDHDENRLVSSPHKTLLYYQVWTSWHLKGSLCSFSDRWTPGVCKVVSKVDQTRKHGRRRKQSWADRGSLAETAGEGSSPWWHLKEVERNRDRCSE